MTPKAAPLFLLLFLVVGPAVAAPKPSDAPPPFVPHYMSQRPEKAYLREGPTYRHRILWIYRHKGYPFFVTASFDIWRRVRDVDGTVGWMSVTMLSDARTVLVRGKVRIPIRQKPERNAKIAGLADPGAILSLKTCTEDMCRVSAQGIDGWIDRARLWGVDPGEIFK